MGKIENRLTELGITLPKPPVPPPTRRNAVLVGEVLYLAGTTGAIVDPFGKEIGPIRGKLGRELSIEDGQRSARYATIKHLAMIKEAVGDLDKVVQIIRVIGYINAAPGFQQAPQVLNGTSELLLSVFGEAGRHARAALYQHEMTNDAPIEIEMMVHVKA
jgi:enamine deaminase RidA (YjgF/YER057c/UK114 family)